MLAKMVAAASSLIMLSLLTQLTFTILSVGKPHQHAVNEVTQQRRLDGLGDGVQHHRKVWAVPAGAPAVLRVDPAKAVLSCGTTEGEERPASNAMPSGHPALTDLLRGYTSLVEMSSSGSLRHSGACVSIHSLLLHITDLQLWPMVVPLSEICHPELAYTMSTQCRDKQRPRECRAVLSRHSLPRSQHEYERMCFLSLKESRRMGAANASIPGIVYISRSGENLCGLTYMMLDGNHRLCKQKSDIVRQRRSKPSQHNHRLQQLESKAAQGSRSRPYSGDPLQSALEFVIEEDQVAHLAVPCNSSQFSPAVMSRNASRRVEKWMACVGIIPHGLTSAEAEG
jgi:hypothetical protein